MMIHIIRITKAPPTRLKTMLVVDEVGCDVVVEVAGCGVVPEITQIQVIIQFI
jgi:hypothetical protein